MRGIHPIPDLNVYYALFLIIPLLFAICWFTPNSIQIARWMRGHLRLTDREQYRAQLRGTPSPSFFRSYFPAAITGICFYIAVTSISHVKSAFLYFNF
jgi:hypothetical protein